MFSLIRRAKNLKNLVLAYLEQTNTAVAQSLENDTALLQASNYLVESFQQQQQEQHRWQAQVTQELTLLQQQVQSLLVHNTSMVVRLETDEYALRNPEIGLICHLYAYLPSRNALDIGANTGEVSKYLLETGYTVYAFEPLPSVFEILRDRFQNTPHFHPYNLALGSKAGVMDLHLATDLSSEKKYEEPSVYSSLLPHAMPADLPFASKIQVSVDTLENLQKCQKIPADIGLVKIDTEGFDIEVIRGMADYRYPVVSAEFWDSRHFFGKGGELETLVREMKQRDYHWYIVLYRAANSCNAAFYCNHAHSLEKSWGNVFFFQDHNLFSQGLKWCSVMLPTTYFAS